MFFARIVYAKARTRALQRTAPGRLRVSRLLLPADPPRSSRATLRRPSAVSELESLAPENKPPTHHGQLPLQKVFHTHSKRQEPHFARLPRRLNSSVDEGRQSRNHQLPMQEVRYANQGCCAADIPRLSRGLDSPMDEALSA